MAFLEINADVKLLTSMLERIARCLERFLLESYQVKLGHCAEAAVDPDPSNPATVDYANDAGLVREALTSIDSMLKHGRTREPESAVEQDHDPDRNWKDLER